MPSHPFRLATFNTENLFSRPNFWDPEKKSDQQVGNVFFDNRDDAVLAKRIAEATLSDEKCQLTALALLATRADIVCLQEVDNDNALRSFRETYLKKLGGPEVAHAMRAIIYTEPRPTPEEVRRRRDEVIAGVNYRYARVEEGNDRRGIDVGILSRLTWKNTRSHAAATFSELGVWPAGIEQYYEGERDNPRYLTPSDRIFKRDCLEVEFEIDGQQLVLFVCHFKSMSGGRIPTRIMRVAEALAVRKIIEHKFRDTPGGAAAANWALCGDLNDYTEIDGNRDIRDYQSGQDSPSALNVLLDDGFAVNIMARRRAEDRWTTYHAPDDTYVQLDYILLSPAMAAANPEAVPEIVRFGQPHRATRHEGPRFARIGWDRPKASDHSPVYVDLVLPEAMGNP